MGDYHQEARQQVVLVTGASRGIGFELCRELLLHHTDYTVLLGSRDIEKGKHAKNQILSESAEDSSSSSALASRLHVVSLDVTAVESITAVRTSIESRFGGILDVLVNNAGINFDSHQQPSTADLKYVEETLDTNLMGAWRCIQEFLPLLQRSSNARIVNVSSDSGRFANLSARTPSYSISKVALNALTVQFAQEFPHMRINAVCPGWVRTDMGGPDAPGPVSEGVQSILQAIWIDPQSGPTGCLLKHGKRLEW